MASPTNFDPDFQESQDGPLTDAAIARFRAIQARSRLSLDEIGARIGVSGSFLGNLLRRYTYKGNVTALRTLKHAERIKAVLLDMERAYGIVTGQPEAGIDTQAAQPKMQEALQHHIKAIHALGFAVTLTPLGLPQR